MPVLRTFPNLFVGLGLFFTFVGLIAALASAVEGLTPPIQAGADAAAQIDPDVVRRSLTNLLRAASTKFYASAAALLVSLVLTIALRVFVARIERSFAWLCDAFENRLIYSAIESIAMAQLRELKEQSRQLVTFNTDLAMKIGESVESAVGNAMSTVTTKLEEVSASLGEGSVDAIREVSQVVTQQIQGAASDSLQNLVDRLDGLEGSLSGLSENLSRSGSEFQAEMEKALSGFSEGLTDGLKEAVEMLKNATVDSAEKIEIAVRSMVDAIHEAAKAASTDAAAVVGAAGESTANAFSEVAHGLRDGLNESFGRVSEAIDGLSKQLGNSEAEVTRLAEAMDSTAGGLEKTSGMLDETLSHLSEATQGLSAAADLIVRATAAINESVTVLQARLFETNEEIRQATEVMSTQVTLLGEFWSKHASRFEDVDESLERTSEHSATIWNIASNDSRRLLTKHADAVVTLQGAIEELGEPRE